MSLRLSPAAFASAVLVPAVVKHGDLQEIMALELGDTIIVA